MLPAITGSGLSVRVTARSAEAVSVSVSVALLLPGVGSGTAELMVAVLDKVPVAAGEMGAVTVKVKEPPAGRLTELALMVPEPVAGPVHHQRPRRSRSHR